MKDEYIKQKSIRNFCIIAHIDHGKSTLADRMIEMTQTVSKREMKEQLLDDMNLERERGITIKLKAIHMYYDAKNGQEYEFNLIDTPGHADFNYEVSRSLVACEGALLVIDATQGIQAQTMANLRLAQEQNLKIIPVINKIDMPSADPDNVLEQLEEIEGIDTDLAILASARTGEGVIDILESITKNIPYPNGISNDPLQALIFDSYYDSYKGVILNIKVVNGKLKPGMKVNLLATNRSFEVGDVGVFNPKMQSWEELTAGEVGYVITGIKEASDIKIGDTIADNKDTEPLPGYKDAKPMVFAGFFPLDNKEQDKLREAVEKLALNDSALIYQPEVSATLGVGFRCGFLGILHMEIVQERLEREFDLEILTTAPSVEYHVHLKTGEDLLINNPYEFPSFEKIEYIEEPFIDSSIIIPVDNLGAVIELCSDKRGIYEETKYLNSNTVELFYKLPMSEIVYDFYDSLKSITHGYASIDYREVTYRVSDLVKVDIGLNDEQVDAFSFIVSRDKAYEKGKEIVGKMKYLIPRKLYPMPVQSIVENKVIAREDIPPLRKSVTGKGFSGSTSKKKRAAKKISENKKRQRSFGKADIPQEAFHAILSIK